MQIDDRGNMRYLGGNLSGQAYHDVRGYLDRQNNRGYRTQQDGRANDREFQGGRGYGRQARGSGEGGPVSLPHGFMVPADLEVADEQICKASAEATAAPW
jgi:hypothetical protein